MGPLINGHESHSNGRVYTVVDGFLTIASAYFLFPVEEDTHVINDQVWIGNSSTSALV